MLIKAHIAQLKIPFLLVIKDFHCKLMSTGLDRYRRQVREFAAGVGYRGRNLCVDSDFANILAAEMRELHVDPETSGEVAEVRKYLERRRRFWQNMGGSYGVFR